MDNLKLALTAVREYELMKIPSEKDMYKTVSISTAFEKRMEKLWRDSVSTWPQHTRKSILLIAILAAMMASAMSVQAIRDPIVNFFLDIYEHYTDIVFQVSKEETEESSFFIPEPPEGYEETSREVLQTQVKIEYTSETGLYLRYTQFDLDGLSMSVNTEGADFRTEEIQGTPAFVYSKNGLNGIVWSDGNFGYKVNATCSLPELMEIVEEIVNGSN